LNRAGDVQERPGRTASFVAEAAGPGGGHQLQGGGVDTPGTALVMPVYQAYARAVGQHPDRVVSLVRGWRDPRTPPMRAARRLVAAFGLVPVLFRPVDLPSDDHSVTHAAVCGLVAYRDEVRADPRLCTALDALRVERLALGPTHPWYAGPVDQESTNHYA